MFMKIHLKETIKAYPNPVYGEFVYFDTQLNIQIYNSFGQLVLKENNVNCINVGHFKSGIYMIITETGQSIKLIIQ